MVQLSFEGALADLRNYYIVEAIRNRGTLGGPHARLPCAHFSRQAILRGPVRNVGNRVREIEGEITGLVFQ